MGISLTLGINSCRDNHRKKTEAEESVMEAVGNISIRTEQTGLYVGILEKQNEIYQLADSIYQSGAEIPDSICVKFKSTLPQIQTTISDHGFEKIFRESYQLWQVLDQKELTDLINCSFEILNYTETLSTDLIDSMLEQIVMCCVMRTRRCPARMPGSLPRRCCVGHSSAFTCRSGSARSRC